MPNRCIFVITLLSLIVGVPREIKPQEGRINLTPAAVSLLTAKNLKVVVQSNCGAKSGYGDAYSVAGAVIAPTAKQVWDEANLIVKVKEPVSKEYRLIRPNHIIFTFLHLAGNKPLAEALLRSGATAIAYETVVKDGRTILLEPSSIIAGVLGAYQAVFYLTRAKVERGQICITSAERQDFERQLNTLTFETLFTKLHYDLHGKIVAILGGSLAKTLQRPCQKWVQKYSSFSVREKRCKSSSASSLKKRYTISEFTF